MKEEIKSNLQNTNTWLRLLFMALFAAFFFLALFIFGALLSFQMLVALITGSANERIRPFHNQLSQYLYQVLLYISYCTEEKPFPFADWPEEKPGNSTSPPPVNNPVQRP